MLLNFILELVMFDMILKNGFLILISYFYFIMRAFPTRAIRLSFLGVASVRARVANMRVASERLAR